MNRLFSTVFLFVLSLTPPLLLAAADAVEIPGLVDKGIFSDLDATLDVPLMPIDDPDAVVLHVGMVDATATLAVNNVPVATWPVQINADKEIPAFRLRPQDQAQLDLLVSRNVKTILHADKPPFTDKDRDRIPDQVDILRGALKDNINNADYDGSYYQISRNGGDVPRNRGCCTDVVIRSLRNAGYDLQELLQKDIARRPKAYGAIDTPNASIDHRRVKNLIVYFLKHFKRIENPEDVSPASKWLPGDIVFFDTLSKPGPDHVGVVSSRRSPSGNPLIINNWTIGATVDEMDLLAFVTVTDHFRLPH